MKHVFTAIFFTSALAFAGAAPAAQLPQSDLAQEQVQSSSVNINKADIAELQSALFGVGEAKAQAIVDYRTANGDFASVDEILEVKGIGPAILERNRDRLSLD